MSLTFDELRQANIARIPKFKNKHGNLAHSKADGSDWSPAQWLQALTGEVGEYANLRKKFERGDISQAEFDLEAPDELADIQTYLDILAMQINVDLGKATIKKFNEVSKRADCDVFLNENRKYNSTLYIVYRICDLTLKLTREFRTPNLDNINMVELESDSKILDEYLMMYENIIKNGNKSVSN